MIAVDHSRSVAWDTAMDMVGTVVSNRLRPSTFKSWSLLLCLVMSLSQTVCGGRTHRTAKTDPVPVFQPTPQNITVGPGDRAVLKCRIEHLGTKTVVWRREKDLHPLTIGMFTFVADERISVDYNQRTNEWSLIIHNVNPADEATYNCQISTKDMNTRSYKIKLNVKKKIPKYEIYKAVQVTGTEYVERGSALHLVCNASGKPDPPHDVQWFKSGERLQSDASRSILITKKIETKALISVLVIQKSTMTDAGDYICRSSNKDTGTLRVHILNVASSQIKRGAKKATSVNSRAHLHHISDLTLLAALWLGHWWHRA